jgi:rubredoxin
METGGYDLWKNVMANDLDALKTMGEYCDQDVIVLEAVYQEMKGYFKQNTHEGVLEGRFKFSCPSCSSTKVDYLKLNSTPMGAIRRLMNCKICNHTYEVSNASYVLYLKFLSKNFL